MESEQNHLLCWHKHSRCSLDSSVEVSEGLKARCRREAQDEVSVRIDRLPGSSEACLILVREKMKGGVTLKSTASLLAPMLYGY